MASMDSKMLEFWGNFLLSAAKGQEQIENMSRLFRDGFKTFEQQFGLFQKFYNLDKETDATASCADAWTKAAADFMKSYQEFIGLMGMIPKENYEALARENEELKKQVAALEEALNRRTAQTGSQDTGVTQVMKGFEGLMRKQAEQFQSLMASYGEMHEAKKPGRKSSDTNPPEVRKKRG
jgi:hypothetical protein